MRFIITFLIFTQLFVNNVKSDDVTCQKIVSYFSGKFEADGQASFSAQFQINVLANQADGTVTLTVDHVNQEYMGNDDSIFFHFFSGGGNAWCDDPEMNCSIPIIDTGSPLIFHVHDTLLNESYSIMKFDQFINQFVLSNSIGGCTKDQLSSVSGKNLADPEPYKYCVCCDTYTPDVSLDCPYNHWYNPNGPCETLVGYYVGAFGPPDGIYPDEFYFAQFQFKLVANESDHQLHFFPEHVNKTYSGTASIFFHLFDNPPAYTYGIWQILYFPRYFNNFSLNTPTGNCGRNQLNSTKDYFPDQSRFDYCICCDSYDPEDSLECPKSPWIHKTTTTKSTTITTTTKSTTITTTTTQIIPIVPTNSTTKKPTSRTTPKFHSTTTAYVDRRDHPFGINCSRINSELDKIYCNTSWDHPDNVPMIVNLTMGAFTTESVSKADVFELSSIFNRLGRIDNIKHEHYDHVYNLYDKILGIDENKFWAANGENAQSSITLLNGLHELMSNTGYDLNLLHGTNVGLLRNQTIDCDPKNYMGLADYGDSFGPSNGKDYIASIEIPMDILCNQNSDTDPIYYAIYRRVNLFVPNSTDEESKKDHLTSEFYALDDSSEGFDPEKNPPKTERCAIGFYQNKNRVLTATIINRTEQASSKTMAVLKYQKSKVKTSLHGKPLVSWWDGDKWSSDKTCTVHSDGDYYVANCNHLTDFTLLIDGAQTDPTLCDKTLSAFGYATNGGSIFSLLALNIVYSFNLFSPLRDLAFALFIAQPLLRFKVDLLTAIYNIMLMFFYIFFTILNDQRRTGGNTGCQIIAAIDYWLLLCCIFLTLFQAWRILKIFAFNSRMEQLIIFITKPLVIIIASLAIPASICVLAFVISRDFYNRKDSFCWINPSYVTLAVVLPLTILILNGLICLFLILLRMYPNSRIFKPLSRLASVQSNLISQAQKNVAREKIITVIIMQFTLGIPWAVQYLTLFSPRATAWHYIFTLVIGTQGIVLLLLFLYKRYQAYRRQHQQITTTSGGDTAITNARSVGQEPKSESRVYDPVPYDYERPRRTESMVGRARQFVINKLSTNQRPSNQPPPVPPSMPPPLPPTSTIPTPSHGLRRLH